MMTEPTGPLTLDDPRVRALAAARDEVGGFIHLGEESVPAGVDSYHLQKLAEARAYLHAAERAGLVPGAVCSAPVAGGRA